MNKQVSDQIEVGLTRLPLLQSVKWQSSLNINFKDFEKAFDSVNREGMWQLIWQYGIPSKIVTIIKTLYETFTVQVVETLKRTTLKSFRS